MLCYMQIIPTCVPASAANTRSSPGACATAYTLDSRLGNMIHVHTYTLGNTVCHEIASNVSYSSVAAGVIYHGFGPVGGVDTCVRACVCVRACACLVVCTIEKEEDRKMGDGQIGK